jgi:secondary thiamine-phosphate synthase enzyme
MTSTAGKFALSSSSRMEMVDITAQVQKAVADSDVGNGPCTIYSPHTIGGLNINEGADPGVRKDLVGVLRHMVPSDFPYRHQEGNSPRT